MVNSFEIGGVLLPLPLFSFSFTAFCSGGAQRRKEEKKKKNELGLLGFEHGSLYLQNYHLSFQKRK
ncbi:hypothetical protein ACJW30_03G045900 [Castanea mollissima]